MRTRHLHRRRWSFSEYSSDFDHVPYMPANLPKDLILLFPCFSLIHLRKRTLDSWFGLPSQGHPTRSPHPTRTKPSWFSLPSGSEAQILARRPSADAEPPAQKLPVLLPRTWRRKNSASRRLIPAPRRAESNNSSPRSRAGMGNFSSYPPTSQLWNPLLRESILFVQQEERRKAQES